MLKRCAVLLFALCFLLAPAILAEDAALRDALSGLGSENRDDLLAAIRAIGQIGDGAALPALDALQNDKLRIAPDGRVLILEANGKLIDALDNTEVTVDPASLKKPSMNNRVRKEIKPVIAKLRLMSPDFNRRLAAAKEVAQNPKPEDADAIRAALEQEPLEMIRTELQVALALIDLNSADNARRIEAVTAIGKTGNQNLLSILKPLLEKNADGTYIERDAKVVNAAEVAVRQIQWHVRFITFTQNVFYGLSLGSILLLAALGLAITFGLMQVINMAHGEMLMLGAYATYVTQHLFLRYLPGLSDWYLFVAIPIAFVVAGLVGMLLEFLIIRHLYGRPLETMLATWGISLVLIQTIRLIFGAQNVEVANPSWLSGGSALTPGLMITYNRLAIIVFVAIVTITVWTLLNRSRMGVKVRAVTQNRAMASAIGIFSSRVDMWTFGLGSGIAGLGGVALSQIGNVGPELGQSYIIDSFMVVVLGGVGNLAGTIVGAMSLGIVNKFLEPFTGAVLGKIVVLVFIILFIQKRPQGLFALKGRTIEG